MYKKTRQYVLLAAIAILAGFAGYFQLAADYMQNALLNERLRSVERDMSYICGAVDFLVAADDGVWKYEKYQTMLEHITALIDATENTYAELLAADYTGLSERIISGNNEISLHFDPRKYPELMGKIGHEDSGTTVIPHKLEDGMMVDVHVYWRWIPTGSHHQNRVLFIAGVTKYSVSLKIASWLTYGIVALFTASVIFIIGSVMLVTVEARRKPEIA
jgi:hypothetical protein